MSFIVGKNCKIHPSVILNVENGYLGDGAVLNEGVRIEGKKVIIGRECFMDRYATIGGGSCFDPQSEFIAGDWLHMGVNSHINSGYGVYVGHEFGCGVETKIFTHGAYTDSYNIGAPVEWASVHIGDNVWLPNAWVNPGVKIGHQVVVAARSLINRDLPDRCLAAGIPVKILKENYLPRAVNKESLVKQILEQTERRLLSHNLKYSFLFDVVTDSLNVQCNNEKTLFDLKKKTIIGTEGNVSAVLKDQLRRNGIRFRYEWSETEWSAWKK